MKKIKEEIISEITTTIPINQKHFSYTLLDAINLKQFLQFLLKLN